MSHKPEASPHPATEPAESPDIYSPCADHETRCGCGRLLLKELPQGWEIKCPRCKRRWLMQARQSGSSTVTLIPCDSNTGS